MVLYWDNFITNTPLAGDSYPYQVINEKTQYQWSSKFDVALYSLHSMSTIPFTGVFIHNEIENGTPEQYELFEKTVFELWKNAVVSRKRSTTKKNFIEKLLYIENAVKDDVIFYAGNCDHVYIQPDNESLLDCVSIMNKYPDSAVVYSHFQEVINYGELGFSKIGGLRQNKPNNSQDILNSERILENNSFYKIVSFRQWNASICIYKMELLKKYLGGNPDYPMKRIDLTDCIPEWSTLIIPKRELFRHFDGYCHVGIEPSDVPPLFIPTGFWEKKIKINCDANNYMPEYVNISPSSQYIFENPKGTDLKLTVNQLPAFWKDRISEVNK